jgi:hypothetical protein
LGDRAYALIDTLTGKVASAKSVKLFPGLLDCQATFLEAPQPGREPPHVRIVLPDGTVVKSDASSVDQRLSAWFKREVTLARTAPQDFTIDQYHPDVEDLDPAGHRDTVVEQKLGSALFAEAGLASPVPEGSFFDLFPVSVMTTSTLERLRELAPNSKDTDILRTLARHNRIQVGDIGQFPCAGVYAVVGAQGPLRTGDGVKLS